MDMTPQTWPEWYDGRHINGVLFCQQFLEKHPMKCVRGRLFTVDGLIEDEGQIGNLILEEISGCLTSGLSKVVANLLASIKLQAYSPPLPIETDRIHVANGTYFMDGCFSEEKSYCNNRLTVSYDPNAPAPKRWLQFLSELLQEDDIPTLQEFLGYCLLPTTKGQKMLLLIGKGGEGKSRIGLVMRSLLGDSMNTTSIQKVESNRFSRADLENKLLMVDDDMDMSALPKTNYIKSIVTSECKMGMERKGVQSYQSQLYVRFLCFGNGALTALHDKSDGFFRRQIVLTTKDRPAGRADDPFLVDKLLREKEGIFLWCLEGLHRLIGNNYQFSISGKARENMETVKRSSNNVIEFLQSEGYIRFKADSEASSKALHEAYQRWCEDNAQKPMSAKLVLYHEAIDYLREMQRRRDRELSFSDLPQMEMDKLCVVDHYPSDRFTFSSHGYDLHIENELVADAFAGLSVQEQSILILHFVLDLPDQEVGRLVGMSRSAVQRRRAKSLTELRIKLAALMPKGG